MDILRQFTLVVVPSTQSMAVFRPELLILDRTVKILKAMYYILHDSPVRREIYAREGETTIYPLR